MKTGEFREYIEFQSPASSQVRDDYGHRTDDASNYSSEFYAWANVGVKNDLTAEILV